LGKFCHININLQLSGITSAPTGYLVVQFLPFAAANVANAIQSLSISQFKFDLQATTRQVGVVIPPGQTYLYFTENYDNADNTTLQTAGLLASSYVVLSGIYMTM
jgi:hypothetical protein